MSGNDKKNVWSVHIQATPERVWETITKADVPQPFYYGTVLRGGSKVGETYRYESRDGRVTFIEGRVIAADRPKRLVHTFRFTDVDEAPSTVTYELVPESGGTRLHIVHDGLAAKHLRRVKGGWTTILNGMKSWMETGKLPLKSRAMDLAFRLIAPFLPTGSKGTQASL